MTMAIVCLSLRSDKNACCMLLQAENGYESSPSDSEDAEMEAELIHTVTGRDKDDPLSAYDIDVAEDGEAIQMYMSLLASAKAAAGSSA